MEKEQFDKLKEQILSREEMMALFNVSTITIHKWAKDGLIREYRLERKPYYIKDEVLADLRNNGSHLRKSHRGTV